MKTLARKKISHFKGSLYQIRNVKSDRRKGISGHGKGQSGIIYFPIIKNFKTIHDLDF